MQGRSSAHNDTRELKFIAGSYDCAGDERATAAAPGGGSARMTGAPGEGITASIGTSFAADSKNKQYT